MAHSAFDPRDPSDFADRFCQGCWDVGEPFRAREKLEMDRHDEATEQIEKEWRDAAIAALKVG